MNIRPVDLPELRAEALLHQDAHGDFMMSMWRDGLKGHSPNSSEAAVAEASRLRWRHEIEALGSAEIFHVSKDMTELARVAARTLPTFAVHPEDLPCLAGLTAFEEPISDGIRYLNGPSFPVRAILWSILDGNLACTPYVLEDDVLSLVDPDRRAQLRSNGPRLMCMAKWMFGTPIGRDTNLPNWENDSLFPLLLSTWLLMMQPLARIVDVTPDRAARKRARRSGREPSPVRVIELRRSSSFGGQGESESNYRHRWIVRGHWRQQWFPKREVHRPVWIAPHIKGPEGAPLIGGEKVYAWKR